MRKIYGVSKKRLENKNNKKTINQYNNWKVFICKRKTLMILLINF